MSNMFDPSKLNIDFSDIWGNPGGPKKDDDDKKKKENEEKKEEAGFNPDAFLVEKDEKSEEKVEKTEQKVTENEEKSEDFSALSDLENLLDDNSVVEKVEEEVKENVEETEKEKIEEIDVLSEIEASVDVEKGKPEEAFKIEEDESENSNNIVLPEVESKIENKAESKVDSVIDMSLTSLDDLVDILLKESYDFIVVEPFDDYAKVIFKKEGKEVLSKNINIRVYTKVIFKAKQIGKLDLEKEDVEQKAETPYSYKDLDFKALVKVVPSPFGEKLFFKPKVMSKAKKVKKKEKIWIGKIFSFLSAILLLVLIMMGAFIAFIVMNAKWEEDVALFMQLWINIWEINIFIKNIVLTVFTILVFIESIFLAIFTFRALLTKAEYKRKKTISGFMALLLFFMVVWTGTFGLNLYKWELPDWASLRLWKIQIYDNDKLLSSMLGKEESLLRSTDDLIWPITIKYNLEKFEQDKLQEWFKINEYVWMFGDEEVRKQSPELIRVFDTRGINRVSLKVVWTALWETKELPVSGIKDVNITGVIDYEEKVYPSGWKKISFDARDISEYGKAKWFIYDPENDKLSKGYEQQVYKPAKIFKKDTVILMKLIKWGKENLYFDKMFFISMDRWTGDISGEIEAVKSYENPLDFTFKVKNLTTWEANGFVDRLEWVIWSDVKLIREINLENIEDSSTYKYTFSTYGKKTVKLRIYDELNNVKEIETEVEVPRQIKLSRQMVISNEWENYDMDEVFNPIRWEVSLDNVWAPTTINFNAERVRAERVYYRLEKVSWDTDWDWEYDKETKVLDFEVPYTNLFNLKVKFDFRHLKNKEDVVSIEQNIFIDAVEKESQLSLKLLPESEYAPTVVKFDATASKVKNDDIISFIYDYGDGSKPDIRDAYNPWHQYLTDWSYNVTLTVKTASGKEFKLIKPLILKPKPEKAVITTSLKSPKVNQEIYFTSGKSTWEIRRYYWDFWDGQSSSRANTDHFYKERWEYTVKLKLTFESGNIQTTEKKITVE